jgi:hypothetical protein
MTTAKPSTDDLFTAKPPKRLARVPVKPKPKAEEPILWPYTPGRPPTMDEVLDFLGLGITALESVPLSEAMENREALSNTERCRLLEAELRQQRRLNDFLLQRLTAFHVLSKQGFFQVPNDILVKGWVREEMTEELAEVQLVVDHAQKGCAQLEMLTLDLVEQGYVLAKRPVAE